MSKLTEPYFIESKFGGDKVERLNNQLKQTEVKRYTSFLIDKSYLDAAIDKTIDVYREIYPDRSFERPSIEETIKNILSMYDNFKAKNKKINCYVFSSDDDSGFMIREPRLETKDGVAVNIYPHVSEDRVTFEMQEHINRIINTENVMLASNDMLFEQPLNALKEKGVDVTLITYSTDDGRDIFTHHIWGDIMYPIAQAFGLTRYEW